MEIVVTNSRAWVNGSPGDHNAIYSALSYRIPETQLKMMRSPITKKNPYRSLYDRRKKWFPSGLLSRVSEHLSSVHISPSIIDQRVMPKRPQWPVQLHGITLRPEQVTACTRFLTMGQGILKLGTGAGKTECAVAIAKACGVPTIFLTHRVNLVYQAAERFAKRWPESKSGIGIVGNGNFDIRPLTFATVQTLHSAIKQYGKEAIDMLKPFQLMIIDEAHRVGADQFHRTADLLQNAYWRLGLTATPFMSDDPADNLHLEGTIGRVVHEVTPTTLIEEGTLAKPFFKFFEIDQPRDLEGLRNWRDIYEEGIINNTFRNRVIAGNTAKLVDMGYKPLVIVQELAHGKILFEAIQSAGKRVSLVTGADDVGSRVSALKGLSKGSIDVIVSTNIFDEGIDVADVSSVIFASGGKSPMALFQRTGRAIRKKEGRNNAIIIDFIDRQHKTLLRHSLRRQQLVRSEPGFQIV
jgi:superfamily II DNA or RNA helicase